MKPQPINIGIVQHSPEFLNLEASITKMEMLCREAKQKEVDLLLFGETWLCGYPAWIDYVPEIALWDYPPTKEIYQQMIENGLAVNSPAFKRISALSKQFEIYLIVGANEVVEKGVGSGSIYNAIFTFSPQGELINHHRKLMPTYGEKLLYAPGDGYGLHALDTAYGRIGSLICWEHWMPLTRQAMHLENELIHFALWPTVNEVHQLASRHYAFEGRCFVVAAGQVLRKTALPQTLVLPDDPKNSSPFLLRGGSCIIGPNGQFLLEPQFDTEAIFTYRIEDPGAVYGERMTLDVTGHYNRSDIFDLKINKGRNLTTF